MVVSIVSGCGNRHAGASIHEQRARHIPYPSLSLFCLIQHIVQRADPLALRSLLESRQIFRQGGQAPLLLSQFLERLREDTVRDGDLRSLEMADWAYDQTLERFSHLPPSDNAQVQAGPDCRHYYRAVLVLLERWQQAHQQAGQLEEEAAVARILQRLVVKHFHLGRLDYCRRPGATSRRYVWRVKGRGLTLWRPAHIPGRELRKWLETHFPDADPARPGEGERIQAAIDNAIPSFRTVSLEASPLAASQRAADPPPLHQVMEAERHQQAEQIALRLVDVVAEEKVAHLDRQRPAIRRLGREGLRQLIERIFQAILEEGHTDRAVAEEFGLSKATYSRFAGLRWSERLGDGGQAPIPDLWRNLAHIVAGDAGFLVAAIQAGVLPRLRETLAALGEGLVEVGDDG